MDLYKNKFGNYLPKENQELPDNYGIEVNLRDGSKLDFECVSHNVLKEFGFLEIFTKDERTHLLPLDILGPVVFDKRWRKIVELKQEINASENG